MISLARINQYYNELHEVQRFSQKTNEETIRYCFFNLLNDCAKEKSLILAPEVRLPNSTKKPDGVLLDVFRFQYGYWEAKDSKDDLEKEVQHKISIGYPTDNLLVQNPEKAVLVRHGVWEHYDMTDARILQKLLLKFLDFEREEARHFKDAIKKFKEDLPAIAKLLKEMIELYVGTEQEKIELEKSPNQAFVREYLKFYEICQVAINPKIRKTDINEMIVQHILTKDIFRSIFDNTQYHEENNIAQALDTIEKTFFVGELKRNTLNAIKPYYKAIQIQSATLKDHEDKQDFLKSIYESFYQAYNPKGADKLGIVYTPSEIVNFMIDSTDFLLEKHFQKSLSDKGVEILDPATGTGTFITHLIKKINLHQLPYKYEHELHANELSILPYYIANLNIEYIYAQRMGTYKNFTNICWVDTLDNLAGMQKGWRGMQSGYEVTSDMFGLNEENTRRIKNQNEKTLTVIIGNPPYNANQQNENDNNKNRTYEAVDGRIKDTYIKESTAQKSKQYDMYKRFIRWASDRIAKNGIICVIVNRSFIDKRQDDGFRKTIEKEFDYCYVVDLGGDVRAEGAAASDNVFGIMIGVAVLILVKKG